MNVYLFQRLRKRPFVQQFSVRHGDSRTTLHKPLAKSEIKATGLCNDEAMVFGYARVSTDEQDTRAQERALSAAGADTVFTERASGGRWDRPELQRLLDQLRPNDVVLVWKLDRLSRSLKDLLTLLERIEAKDAGFKNLTEAIDTTTPAGRMMMQMVGAFAEFERAMIRERTLAGLKEAKANGRTGGRRKKLKSHQEKEIAMMVLRDDRPAAQVARLFDVHPSTVGRIVARHRLESNL